MSSAQEPRREAHLRLPGRPVRPAAHRGPPLRAPGGRGAMAREGAGRKQVDHVSTGQEVKIHISPPFVNMFCGFQNHVITKASEGVEDCLVLNVYTTQLPGFEQEDEDEEGNYNKVDNYPRWKLLLLLVVFPSGLPVQGRDGVDPRRRLLHGLRHARHLRAGVLHGSRHRGCFPRGLGRVCATGTVFARSW